MILQALVKYYDQLVADGKLEKPGWQSVKVTYALELDGDGSLIRVLPLFKEEADGKKRKKMLRTVNVPTQAKRAVGIIPNFLCDNASYLLGIDAKGKPERTVKCFEASRERHTQMLGESNNPVARAIVRYFGNWIPQEARKNPALSPYLDEIISGGNLVFYVDGHFAHEEPEIQQLWDDSYITPVEGEKLRCLVTGELETPARLHPSISGVAGGQSSGTSLVSFNARAFESFGRDGEQGLNAPVSERAAFAYGAALNYMISQEGHHIRISDTTVVFWAENAADVYASACAAMYGGDVGLSEQDLYSMLENLSAGRKTRWNEDELDPDMTFYILGLAPNAARLSVRYFLKNSFGNFAKNLFRHHNYLNIVRPNYDLRETLSFWQILAETVNQKSTDKTPSPLLSGALVRAVLSGTPYPRLLLEQVELRIRAEHEVTRGRAAIIKAYLVKDVLEAGQNDQYEEVLCVELNENATYQPYLLGRLFAVLENLQEEAAKPAKLNTTIRDRFFNSACTTPAIVYPQLLRLAQAHLKKLGGSGEANYNKKIGEIMEKMQRDYPAHLNLYDQGVFQIGYYHQRQNRFTKKEEK